MTKITLRTIIHAPLEICFDLSRSIDLHIESTKQSNEKAIDGRTSGLIEEGEFVTWEATHFFIRQRLTTRIVEMKKPNYFKDVMVNGAFKSMGHEHHFQSSNGSTVMIDQFCYEVPFRFMGKVFDYLILKGYMTRLLVTRNEMIKKVAEKKWGNHIDEQLGLGEEDIKAGRVISQQQLKEKIKNWQKK
jgi:ligand-binding SRPBCC domain-containing protein